MPIRKKVFPQRATSPDRKNDEEFKQNGTGKNHSARQSRVWQIEEKEKQLTHQRNGAQEQRVCQNRPNHSGTQVAGKAGQDVFRGGIVSQGEGGERIGYKIYPKDLKNGEGLGKTQGEGGGNDQEFFKVPREKEDEELSDVVVESARFGDCRKNGFDLVVHNNQIRRLLGNVGSLFPHHHSHIGLLQRGGVVDPVPGDRYDPSQPLEKNHQPVLLRGGDSGKNRNPRNQFEKFPVGQEIKIFTGQKRVLLDPQTKASTPRQRRLGMISGHNYGADSCLLQSGEGFGDILLGLVQEAREH